MVNKTPNGNGYYNLFEKDNMILSRTCDLSRLNYEKTTKNNKKRK